MAPPRPPSPTLRGMEKGIAPKQRTKTRLNSTEPSSSSKTRTKPREKRRSHYSKTAHMYANKPLPALPKPGANTSSSRAPSREGGRNDDPAATAAGTDDSARPPPLNIQRRPKMTPLQGLDTSAVVPPTPPPRDDALAPPPASSSSLTGGPAAAAQTKDTEPRPKVPPRHPGRPSPQTNDDRRSFSGHRNVNHHAGATGHRSNNKVRQLTGCDVDIYDDLRDRLSSLGIHQRAPVDSLLEGYRSGALWLPLTKEEVGEAEAAGAAAAIEFPEEEGASPTTPFPVHGYEPCVGSPEFGSEGTASAAGSRHGSAHFSFSSRPSWSTSPHNNSPHLSFDGGGGAAISPARSRDSFSDNEAALDYHRFASELAGHSSNRPSGELRRFSSQSSSGIGGGRGRGHTREKSSSSLQSLRRASSQSASLAEYSQQRSLFQQNKALAPASATTTATAPPAGMPQKQFSVRKRRSASASFSSKPWNFQEKRKWYMENNKLVQAEGVQGPTLFAGPAPAQAAVPVRIMSPAPSKAPTKAPTKAPVPTKASASTAAPPTRPPTRATTPAPAVRPSTAGAAPTTTATNAELEPRSVFESDSSDEEDEHGIKDSIRGFLRRRMSTHQDSAGSTVGGWTHRGSVRASSNASANANASGSKDDSDKRILDKARERRAEKRSREFKRYPGKEHMSNEELSKWFRDSPTRHILS